MRLSIIMLLLVFPCSQTTSISCLYKLSNINWICWFWFIRTEQAIIRAEPSSSATGFKKSKVSPELEEVVPKVDGGIIGESQAETGRSGDEGTSTGSSGQRLRNLRRSRMVSVGETQRAKAYVPLQISFFFNFMSCSNQAPYIYVFP